MSGKRLCIPWENNTIECTTWWCKVNNEGEKTAESFSNGTKCCAIDKTPDKATNYTIKVYGSRGESCAQLEYTSPRTDKISKLLEYEPAI
jgi:hypothetical protein